MLPGGGGGGQSVARRVEVRWPEALLTGPAQLIDRTAYQDWDMEHSPPSWPARSKQTAFWVAVLGSAAMAGALLIRSRTWRTVSLVVVALAAAGGMAPAIGPKHVVSTDPWRPAAATRPEEATTAVTEAMGLAVGSLRTVRWETSPRDIGLTPLPVYGSLDELAADAMWIGPDIVRVPLQPGRARLFRPAPISR